MKKPVAMTASVVLLLGAFYLVMRAPEFLLSHNVPIDPKDLILLNIDARLYMVQILGGVVLLFGLYLIHRRILALEKSSQSTHEAQMIDRFARAIEQLGTYKLEVQLGGIFALEKIAMESSRDHWMIMEVLTAYLRENTKGNQALDMATQSITPPGTNGFAASRRAPADIQAILTVLGRRKWVEEEVAEMRVLNLRRCNLRYADLRRAYLGFANMRGCQLDKANLSEARLTGTFLAEANLTGANLLKADLRDANLTGANLEGANLRGALLDRANLQGARLNGALLSDTTLEGANLSEATLKNCNLAGVSLLGVNLTNTRLNRVKYDYDTIFPEWVNQDMKEELRMVFQTG